tara:strand:- start:484 stop:1770 length:1287 start_codon:yes stop_codon:yes gene_type:complete
MSDFAGLPASSATDAGFDPDRLARINKTMDAAVEDRSVPGTVTVIGRGSDIVHTHVNGKLDVNRDAPLGMDSLFRMYSQTKPVTAVVLMSLFEEGAFFLNDPVSKWLPEFAEPKVNRPLASHERVRGGLGTGSVESARREITLFDLMTMTSGLPSFMRTPAAFWPTLGPAWEGTGFSPTDTTRFNDPEGSYEDHVVALAQTPLHAHPGEVWNYGSDFDVLSLFLMRLTGQDLDSLFRERVFGPLRMTGASFYCPEGAEGRLVTDHAWNEGLEIEPRDRPETSEKTGKANRELMSGNGLFGGILCTPPDYTRFARMLLNGGELDGTRVLGRKTVELMTSNHIGDRDIDLTGEPNLGFGFGYSVRKGLGGTYTPGTPGTFGWGGAAGTFFFVDPAEDLFGLFFTHVFGYQFNPDADLAARFEKLTYEALI